MTFRITLVLVLLGMIPDTRAQQPAHEHHHVHAQPGATDHAAPTELKILRPPAPEPGEIILSLAELEAIALEKNPTLAQADAAVRSARARAHQAGQYPNPIIGATGDENTPDPTFRGGEIGMFGEGRIVTAGKLRLQRSVFEQQELQALADAEAQRLRVLNAVGAKFYEALGAEWLLTVEQHLAALANEAVEISRELANVGQADSPDLLAAEIEAQRAEVAVVQAGIRRRRAWQQLATAVGDPSLSLARLEGDLTSFPRLENDSSLQRILNESPEVKRAQAGIGRAEATLRRQQVENVPDILLHGGFRYSPFIGRTGAPIGLKGFFDVGVEIPIFDRNKGAITAAKAEVETARHEVERVRLSLRSRLARQYEEYDGAAQLADRYRTSMLPRAQRAYTMYLENFRRMAAAYPQVLIAQRNYFELQRDYVDALTRAWHSAVIIEGMLLSGALDGPDMEAFAPMPVAGGHGGE